MIFTCLLRFFIYHFHNDLTNAFFSLSGRVGPGDSGMLHNFLFDNNEEYAMHSAVHDAFGYLINFHDIGPGYNYMYSSLFHKENPLSGQVSGIHFWKEYIDDIEDELKILTNFVRV